MWICVYLFCVAMCVYVYVCVCMFLLGFLYARLCVRASVPIDTFMCVCVYACVYVSVCVCQLSNCLESFNAVEFGYR